MFQCAINLSALRMFQILAADGPGTASKPVTEVPSAMAKGNFQVAKRSSRRRMGCSRRIWNMCP